MEISIISVDEIRKKKLKKLDKLIKKSYKFAEEHFKYCFDNCNVYIHDEHCIKLAKKHKHSFVNCSSIYCRERVKYFNNTISYEKFENSSKSIDDIDYFVL